jgi:hypothetical protein
LQFQLIEACLSISISISCYCISITDQLIDLQPCQQQPAVATQLIPVTSYIITVINCCYLGNILVVIIGSQ